MSRKDKILELQNDYQKLREKISEFFPKVNETLLLDMLRLESQGGGWNGTTTLEIEYATDGVNLDEKKEGLYKKYDMLPSEKNERVLRFKAKEMYLEDIAELLDEDPDIKEIAGSAEPSEDDQYPSTH